MLDWFSEERAFIASLVIVILIITLVASVIIGLKQARFRSKDEVFGDPERTLGGWYWTLTGVSTILLLWFYFSDLITSKNEELLFIIGPPDGLDEEVVKKCNYRLSLSSFTLPHELAFLVLMEQLFRAISIINGSKYHRV